MNMMFLENPESYHLKFGKWCFDTVIENDKKYIKVVSSTGNYKVLKYLVEGEEVLLISSLNVSKDDKEDVLEKLTKCLKIL